MTDAAIEQQIALQDLAYASGMLAALGYNKPAAVRQVAERMIKDAFSVLKVIKEK